MAVATAAECLCWHGLRWQLVQALVRRCTVPVVARRWQRTATPRQVNQAAQATMTMAVWMACTVAVAAAAAAWVGALVGQARLCGACHVVDARRLHWPLSARCLVLRYRFLLLVLVRSGRASVTSWLVLWGSWMRVAAVAVQ